MFHKRPGNSAENRLQFRMPGQEMFADGELAQKHCKIKKLHNDYVGSDSIFDQIFTDAPVRV